jgi:hypothetical protein
MKRTYLIFAVLIFFSTSCDFNESPKLVEEPTLTKVLRDPLSQKFSLALNKTKELNSLFIGDQSNIEFSRQQEFASIDDFKIFISENFKNPDYVFNTMYELAEIGQEIREKYPDVSNFSKSDLESLVNEGVESEKESKGPNSPLNFRIQGECEEELESSLQTCQNAALVEAAGCGLLSPTIFLALACGGIVYLGELVCIDSAGRSFKICKKYEN